MCLGVQAFIALGGEAFLKLFRVRVQIIFTLTVKIEIWILEWFTAWKWSHSITLYDETFEPEAFLQLAEIKSDGTLYVMIERASYFAGTFPSVDVTVAHVAGEAGAESVSIAVLTSYSFAGKSSRQTFENVAKVIQASANTVSSKDVTVTMVGVLSNAVLEGNTKKLNHKLFIDYRDDKSGVSGALSFAKGVTTLSGMSSPLAFSKTFNTVELLMGEGDDSLTLYATPPTTTTFVVDFGAGNNELEVSADELIGRPFSALFQTNVDVKSGREVNDKLVMTNQLEQATGLFVQVKTGSIEMGAHRVARRSRLRRTIDDDKNAAISGTPWEIKQEGLTEAHYVVGDNGIVSAWDTTVLTTVDTDIPPGGSAVVNINVDSMCPQDGQSTVSEDGTQLAPEGTHELNVFMTNEQTSATITGLVVTVNPHTLKFDFKSGAQTKTCAVYYGFSSRIHLELTENIDEVILEGVTKPLSINALGGADVFTVKTVAVESDTIWDGGAGNNMVNVVNGRKISGPLLLLANAGSNHLTYTSAPMAGISKVGLITFAAAGEITIRGLTDAENMHEFRKRVVHYRSDHHQPEDNQKGTGTELLHCANHTCDVEQADTGIRLIEFFGTAVRVEYQGGQLRDTVRVEWTDSPLTLNLKGAGDYVAVGRRDADVTAVEGRTYTSAGRPEADVYKGNQGLLTINGGDGDDNTTIYWTSNTIRLDGATGNGDSLSYFVDHPTTASKLTHDTFTRDTTSSLLLHYTQVEYVYIEFMQPPTTWDQQGSAQGTCCRATHARVVNDGLASVHWDHSACRSCAM